MLGLHGQMMIRVLVAAALGALIGYERERMGKPAGVRTHGMVALGSALFTVVSLDGFGGAGDPARVAAQIVTGVGFLGAGAILHEGGGVQGLTTAAAVWATAAVGLAAGVGMLVMALETTVLIVVFLRFGPRVKGSPRPDASPRPWQDC